MVEKNLGAFADRQMAFGGRDILTTAGGDGVADGSGEYTSTLWGVAPHESPAVPEKVVRPFESYRERRDQRLQQLRTFPEEENLAISCWGGVAAGDTVALDQNAIGGINIQSKKPNEDEEREDDPIDENWTEIERKYELIQVASEEDPETFIVIRVARESVLEVPSLTVSRTSGSGRNQVTLNFTIPQRTVRVKWLDMPPGE